MHVRRVPIRAGVLVWNQYTTWPAMRQAGARVDALGYDSLWTWDHLYPIIGDPDGPFLEATRSWPPGAS